MVGLMVLSMLQMQDMADIEGDKERGRRTPLIVPIDDAAR